MTTWHRYTLCWGTVAVVTCTGCAPVLRLTPHVAAPSCRSADLSWYPAPLGARGGFTRARMDLIAKIGDLLETSPPVRGEARLAGEVR